MFDAPLTTSAADGTELAWYDSGASAADQRPVVLVHGITEAAAGWEPVAARLSSDRRVVALDLRGHGASASAATYDLAAMAGDVVAVIGAAGLDRPHIVGHSLGGAVVSAVGAAAPVASVVNVDQPLMLSAFKEMLSPAEPLLRDPATFEGVVRQLLSDMAGPLDPAEKARIDAFRRVDQAVVLGVWELILTASIEEIDAVVDGALATYRDTPIPYLSLFGIDPGDGYDAWLADRVPGALVETWADHGHYPHLVDPDRFVQRLGAFWE